jgi:Uma2 family endonuclease
MSQSHVLRRLPGADELVTSDGEPMESERHRRQMQLLIDSLELAWNDRDDFYVGGDMFLYFSETQTRKNDFRGPDVFVVLNTKRRERKAWVVWEEDGKTPDVIIELLSESTEHTDRVEKKRIYAVSLRVSEYFLYDPFSKELIGYTLDPLRAEYVEKEADRRGFLRCERLELWLGNVPSQPFRVEDQNWLRWIDEAGQMLPMPTERANAEAERANAEAERAKVLERELAALKRGR